MNKPWLLALWHPQEEISNIKFDMFLNKDMVKMGVIEERGIGSYFVGTSKGVFLCGSVY